MIRQKRTPAMVAREAATVLCETLRVDEASLGGELAGSKVERGSGDKAP
jgi:hypothetical protein